jgi:hypothetical protein
MNSPDDFKPGDRVTWLQQFSGGYGYMQPVDATVVRVGPKRVLIDAPLKSGGTKQVWVKPESLRRKDGEQ